MSGPRTITVTEITLSGGDRRTADYISEEYAMTAVSRHLHRSEMNTVRIEGRVCYTLYQAEKAVRAHFAKETSA